MAEGRLSPALASVGLAKAYTPWNDEQMAQGPSHSNLELLGIALQNLWAQAVLSPQLFIWII